MKTKPASRTQAGLLNCVTNLQGQDIPLDWAVAMLLDLPKFIRLKISRRKLIVAPTKGSIKLQTKNVVDLIHN